MLGGPAKFVGTLVDMAGLLEGMGAAPARTAIFEDGIGVPRGFFWLQLWLRR